MDHNLRALRRRTGLGQAQLARMAGISRSSISAYESGRLTPRPETVERLVMELRRPSATLYGHRTGLLELARKFGFQSISVFGSCARGEDDPGSDVDLLVDAPDVTLFDLSSFRQDASDLLNGIQVDVVLVGGAGASMDRIMAEAVPL